jgi:hypothetical protein
MLVSRNAVAELALHCLQLDAEHFTAPFKTSRMLIFLNESMRTRCVEHGACHVASLLMTGNENRRSPAKALRATSEARATLGKLATQD